jgi:ubiquinone/menaquinone biosynthesis C-methylase UbiE
LYSRLMRLIYLIVIEPLLHGAKKRVLYLASERRPRDLLEVGCGTCAQAAAIAAKGIEVTAVDISERMFPPRRSARLPSTLSFFRADGRQLPFHDGLFDMALVSMSLHAIDPADRITIIREMIRVLKDGGTVLIMDFDFDPRADRGLTAVLIRFIEKLAGAEHHANFKNFLAAGGVPAVLRRLRYDDWRRYPVMNGRGGVFEFRVHKEEGL